MADSHDFLRTDEDVEQILRLAIREGVGTEDDLQQRLQSSARDLGISEDALHRAIEKYRQQKDLGESMAKTEALRHEYRTLKRRDFFQHLGIYVAVNGGLAAVFTAQGGFPAWMLWMVFGWGVGIVAHLLGAFFPGTDEHQEFEKWARKRQRRSAG